jgi:hypothetical protein
MKTKYHKYSLKGDHSAVDAQRALGEAAVQGTIVRIDSGGGETHVYVASEETSGTKPQALDGKKAATGGVKGQEVTESDVTKLG